MGGVKAVKHWEGGFNNISYNIGPGFKNKNMKLKMIVNNEFKNRTIRNVIGTIKGFVEPGWWILHCI